MDTASLQRLYDLCVAHDWYYAFSDDPASVRRGRLEAANLAKMVRNWPEGAELLTAWQRHMFSGVAFGREQEPRPERPVTVSTFGGAVPTVHPDQMTLAGI